MMKRADQFRGGFTLLEVVIAMAILAIVCAIVYGSFYSVTESTMNARAASEQTKTKQFVMRVLRTNLEQAVQGWLPGAADRVPGGDEDVAAVTFGFVGKDERGPAGPADALEFVSYAPMPGALVLPGMVKRVTYEVVEDDGGEPERVVGAYNPDHPPAAFLQVTEVPMFGLGNQMEDEPAFEDDEKAFSWLLPIRSMDIRYFDGQRWEDEWDADEEGRLPWAVDVRINLPDEAARADEDRFRFDIDREDGPGAQVDVQFLTALPAGTGVAEPPPVYSAQPLPARRSAPAGDAEEERS